MPTEPRLELAGSLLVRENGLTLCGEQCVVFSSSVQHTTRSNDCTSSCLAKENGSICSYRNLDMKDYSSFIHNCPKLETAQIPNVIWLLEG